MFGSAYRHDDEHIRAAEEEGSSSRWGYLITQVIDSGEGIQPKDLKNLFTTFTQTKLSMFKTQGVGIGLSTSKELAQSLSGAIMLESQVNKGTSVTFSVQARDV
jgi:signal transduction histidine kinase